MKQLWNDGWSFLKTENEKRYEKIVSRIHEFTKVDLPHDWLIYDTRNLYENGVGWYRKTFVYTEPLEKRTSLFFEGIYMDSTIYINGQKAAEWKYGYSSFEVDMTSFLQTGENEVLISVCFQSPNSRWYSGAGIYRDVWFVETQTTYLPVGATYLAVKPLGEDFLLHLKTEVCGELADTAQVQYALFDDAGREVALACRTEGERGEVYLVTKPRLWDIDSPVLYTLCTRLMLENEIWQEEKERIGFRSVVFSPEKGFFLNGRHIKLKGVCEHHDLGALGAAFHKEAMRRKMRLLKEMGVNAIRCAHNMMAPGFVELADEMGILLISEAFDMWERAKTPYDYARFFPKWWKKDIESWIKRDRNHPSVIMWSIGNEIYDTHIDTRGAELTRLLKKEVEIYDFWGNARVTIGSNYMPWENAQNCADIVKVAGYNYSEKCYEKHHREHPDWVIYGSETSSIVQSRGIYHFPLSAGILAEEDEQCSALGNSITSWGAKSMEDCITLDRDAAFSMGQFIWTGFDYIGEPTPYHTKNSYFGQLDTAGFPKDSYYVWQSAWTNCRKKPMIHIFPYWDFNEGQMIDVRVCSNAPEVELFINGRSCGRQKLTHQVGSGNHVIADYQVPYEKGRLYAVAYDEKGNIIAEQEKKSFGNAVKLVLYPEKTALQADGRDLLFIEISTLDAEGNPVENACNRVTVQVTGAGNLVGLDNGDSTDYDQYKGITRRLFSGKLLAIIQAKSEPGEITVTVTGKDLKPARLTCSCRETTAFKEITATANRMLPILTGSEDEIPVRKITLSAKEGRHFSKENNKLWAEAVIEPQNATDKEVIFEVVNEKAVPSNLVKLEQDGMKVALTAMGDGMCYLRCKSKSGTDKVRIISQLAFWAEGIGTAYLNPYDFISGSLYTSFWGEVGNGNEKGIATGREQKTIVTYTNIDFGALGSDEIHLPIFTLSDEAYPIQIWEGIPGEAKSELLLDGVYQKPSIWNVYQMETYQLKKRLTGIATLSFLVYQKMHIKGFSFTRFQKAWMQLGAKEADAVYGDSFRKTADGIEGIGNNVSLVFTDMDFGKDGMERLIIKGHAEDKNTIHVRFANGQNECKQIVEFEKSTGWQEREFRLEPVKGKWDVTFVFLPGSAFDFMWFRFEK